MFCLFAAPLFAWAQAISGQRAHDQAAANAAREEARTTRRTMRRPSPVAAESPSARPASPGSEPLPEALPASEREFLSEHQVSSKAKVAKVKKVNVVGYIRLPNNMYPLEEREKDEAFMKDLAAATGQPDLFEGIDPHFWRSVDEEAIQQMTYDYDDDDSDDSTGGMIFRVRNLGVKESTTAHRLNLEVASEMINNDKTSKARTLVADTPDFKNDPDQLEKEGLMWKETGLKKGDLSEEGMEFVSWKMVRNYPETFVGKRNGERTKELFTIESLHKNRIWDVYYLHQPKEVHPKPGLFVPTYQFQHLLDTINARLDINLTIPPGKNAAKFRLVFGDGNTPRPRFLARSCTANDFKAATDLVPRPKPEDDLSLGTEEGQAKLISVFKMIANSHKKGERSKKNAYKRFQSHRSWGRGLKRTQRYLGLREQKSAGSTTPPAVRFVAIDLEAWEQNQNVITEVGIAILDTSDLKNLNLGENGRNWFDAIKARHIQVAENRHFENYRYVKSCPESFDFGRTELIYGKDIPDVMKSIINGSPYPVVLVFHESAADIKFLSAINYNIYEAKEVALEVVDTKHLYQYAIRSGNQPSVGTVCDYLGIQTKNLHNAGNDAVYTLQAMIGLAVKQREESLKRARGKGAEFLQAAQHHVPFAEMVEKDGWTSGGEDSDGGPPFRPAEFEINWSPLSPAQVDGAAEDDW